MAIRHARLISTVRGGSLNIQTFGRAKSIVPIITPSANCKLYRSNDLEKRCSNRKFHTSSIMTREERDPGGKPIPTDGSYRTVYE